MLGTKNLAEILSERETISQVMQNALDEATDPWGVKVCCAQSLIAFYTRTVCLSLLHTLFLFVFFFQAERVEM